MQLRPVLARDEIDFAQGQVEAVDIEAKTVTFLPTERPGEERHVLPYDYLVIAMGAHLAYEKIEGFAEHGHTVSDLFHGNRLRKYLHEGGYKGGPVAIGSAHFHQGNGAEGLEPYPGGSIPYARAACEGPVLELTTEMASYLTHEAKSSLERITVFTPEEYIAADAGLNNIKAFLKMAGDMGIRYRNNMADIARLTAEGIEFADGQTIEAELKLVLPDWVAHPCLKDLPIADNMGFIRTDLLMRVPGHPEIFAAGDSAAVTMPKIGGIGHQEVEIIGRQVALDMGRMEADEANEPLRPVAICIGDMGRDASSMCARTPGSAVMTRCPRSATCPMRRRCSTRRCSSPPGARSPAGACRWPPGRPSTCRSRRACPPAGSFPAEPLHDFHVRCHITMSALLSVIVMTYIWFRTRRHDVDRRFAADTRADRSRPGRPTRPCRHASAPLAKRRATQTAFSIARLRGWRTGQPPSGGQGSRSRRAGRLRQLGPPRPARLPKPKPKSMKTTAANSRRE